MNAVFIVIDNIILSKFHKIRITQRKVLQHEKEELVKPYFPVCDAAANQFLFAL